MKQNVAPEVGRISAMLRRRLIRLESRFAFVKLVFQFLRLANLLTALCVTSMFTASDMLTLLPLSHVILDVKRAENVKGLN